MIEKLLQLSDLCNTASMQIQTLRAVESAFRTDCEAIDKGAFAYPLNGLEDTLYTLSSSIGALTDAVRDQEVH